MSRPPLMKRLPTARFVYGTNASLSRRIRCVDERTGSLELRGGIQHLAFSPTAAGPIEDLGDSGSLRAPQEG